MNRKLIFGLIFLALALPACRRQAGSGEPTPLPTLTPTPRSTPLPAVATAIPAGAEGNPLQMVIRPDGSLLAARNAIGAFEESILEASGLAVQVELVERHAEALAALCASSGGQASVAWLNGASYMAAQAQSCGAPLLQVERGSRREARTGEASSLIVNREANLNSLGALNGRAFCRLGYDDFYSWLAPVLVLRANGLNPLTDLETVTDYEDIPALVQAVAAGDCDAAGIPETALTQYADDIGDAAEDIEVLETSIEFPYAVLVVPPEVPLGTRSALNNAWVALADENETAVTMRALLGQNALLPVNTENFTDLADFIASTGLDFAQLGN